MAAALKELPVEVIQATSDEAQAIRCHVEQTLGAHPSPALFHVQQEVVKGTAGALAAKTRQAEQALTTATRELERQSQAAAADANSGSGPSPERDPRRRQAQWQFTAAEVALEEAQAQQAQAGRIWQLGEPPVEGRQRASSIYEVIRSWYTLLDKSIIYKWCHINRMRPVSPSPTAGCAHR